MDKQRTQLEALGELARILDEVADGALLPPGERLADLLADIHPADLSDLISAAPEMVRLALFQTIPDEDDAARVLASVDEKVRDDLIDHLPVERTAELVHEMANDDAADVLGELSHQEQDAVLARLTTEEASELRELVEHDPDSAGGLMTNEFVAVSVDTSARRALMQVKTAKEDWEDIATLFVVDEGGRLVGVVDLDDLVRGKLNEPVRSKMEAEPVFARVHEDQEAVAQRAVHYRLTQLPVVDADSVLVGVIDADDVMETLGEEASEDMYRLAGTLDHNPTRESLPERLWARFPFLLVTVIGTYLVALLIAQFDESSVDGVIRFIPMIAALAGNAGLQASTTMIRGFATGDIRPSDFRVILGREASLGLLTGACAALVELGILLAADEPAKLCFVVPSAQALSVVLATIFGTVIPFFCLRVKFRVRGREWSMDPALAAGPFITTLNDLVSTAIALALFMPEAFT